ncbi:MAG: TfoX/Sxy family protein [Planctomycetes bacterium]|nr:TfoX/Sxy family protein [Planctomycetota bacterium]
MKQNRPLTDLKNIGQKIAGRLQEVDIITEADLRAVGAVEAHKRLKEKYPNETLPVCYYLYSFEGALCDKHWNDIHATRKRELREEIR